MGSVDDEDELENEAATVMSGQSFDDMLAARGEGSDAGDLSGEPTRAGASADGFDDPDEKTVASPSFDEMERMRAEADEPRDDIAYAQTAMGPSYDERLASQSSQPSSEASSSPAAAGPPPPPPPPSPPPAPPSRGGPTGGAAPPASDPFSPAGGRPPSPGLGATAQAPRAGSPHSPAPHASSQLDEPGGVMPKTMVLGPNDWGGVPAGPPQDATPSTQGSPHPRGGVAPDPFAPAPAGSSPAPYGSQPQSYGYAAPAPHVPTPPPAGGKKNNTLILFLVGMALVLVLGGLAGGALLLVLLARS